MGRAFYHWTICLYWVFVLFVLKIEILKYMIFCTECKGCKGRLYFLVWDSGLASISAMSNRRTRVNADLLGPGSGWVNPMLISHLLNRHIRCWILQKTLSPLACFVYLSNNWTAKATYSLYMAMRSAYDKFHVEILSSSSFYIYI